MKKKPENFSFLHFHPLPLLLLLLLDLVCFWAPIVSCSPAITSTPDTPILPGRLPLSETVIQVHNVSTVVSAGCQGPRWFTGWLISARKKDENLLFQPL